MAGIERSDYRLLVVHPEPALRHVLATLFGQFCHVSLTATGEDALARISRQEVDVMLLGDQLAGTLTPAHVLKEIRAVEPDLAVLLLTSSPKSSKSLGPELSGFVSPDLLQTEAGRIHLARLIERAVLERSRERERNFHHSPSLRRKRSENVLIGESAQANGLREQVRKAIGSDLNLLITGETGVGKSLVAECVHVGDPRRSRKPFVVAAPAALPHTLFEAELFGYVRGAFTGATTNQLGAFEAAAGGTLLLDEVGELDRGLQVKLLDAVETKTVRRLGDPRAIHVDVRIITATNRRLEEDMASGKFREDLFQRLDQLRIHISPLRERRGDILILLRHFIGELSSLHDFEVRPDAEAALRNYDWPGNVRELRNLVRRIVDEGAPPILDLDTLAPVFPARVDRGAQSDLPIEERISVFKRRAYLEELGRHQFNIRETARALSISYSTLRSRLKKLGLLQSVKSRSRPD